MKKIPNRPLVRAALATALLATSLAATSARATTMTVNATTDDLNLGPNGNCTLREAILAANTNAAVDACPAGQPSPTIDLISLPPGTYDLSIAGLYDDANLTGDLDITDDLQIKGSGAPLTIVDAHAVDRVFHIRWNDTTVISDMTIRGGNPLVAHGGGIYVESNGKTALLRDVIRNNVPGLYGEAGGVYQYQAGFLEIRDTTIRDNTASYSPAAAFYGQALLVNSTISGNTAVSISPGYGAFAAISVPYTTGHLTIVHAPFSLTLAQRGYDNDIVVQQGGTATLANTLIDGSCAVFGTGTITSLGGNLESPGTTCPLTQPFDQPGVASAGIGPLSSNFALVETHMPAASSPAYNAADPASCQATDERGVARPQSGACDIGAVERRPGCMAMVANEPGRGLTIDPLGVALPLSPLAVALAFRLRRRRAMTRAGA
ncbi:MAG: CSLREA domain-containing protein [Deltaproteobacteria bacterium]|nr:CSLREA domain-containing protein [Deltaproteobacteria bacterium]